MLRSMKSITAELVDVGEKRDQRGRRLVRAAERDRLLAAYAASGLSQKVFCAREGVAYGTFVAWLGRHRRAGGLLAAGSARARFHELCLPASEGRAVSLEVCLPDGVVVRGRAAVEVAELVRALRD